MAQLKIIDFKKALLTYKQVNDIYSEYLNIIRDLEENDIKVNNKEISELKDCQIFLKKAQKKIEKSVDLITKEYPDLESFTDKEKETLLNKIKVDNFNDIYNMVDFVKDKNSLNFSLDKYLYIEKEELKTKENEVELDFNNNYDYKNDDDSISLSRFKKN